MSFRNSPRKEMVRQEVFDINWTSKFACLLPSDECVDLTFAIKRNKVINNETFLLLAERDKTKFVKMKNKVQREFINKGLLSEDRIEFYNGNIGDYKFNSNQELDLIFLDLCGSLDHSCAVFILQQLRQQLAKKYRIAITVTYNDRGQIRKWIKEYKGRKNESNALFQKNLEASSNQSQAGRELEAFYSTFFQKHFPTAHVSRPRFYKDKTLKMMVLLLTSQS